MNVCMLIWNYWPGPEGGAERQCRKLAGALSKMGCTCTVVTHWAGLRAPGREMDGPVEVRRLGMLGPLVAWATRVLSGLKWAIRRNRPEDVATSADLAALRGRVGILAPLRWLDILLFIVEAAFFFSYRRDRFDVLHIHESHWIAGFGSWIAHKTGARAICKEAFLPCLLPLNRDVPARRRWEWWRTQLFFIAMHEGIRDCLTSKGVPRESILAIIPNGVDLPAETADVSANADVLFVANFGQGSGHKAFDVLLDAWARVSSSRADAHLVWVGAGDAEPWKEHARRLGCAERITFAGGTHRIEDFYCRASVFVLPSRKEGMSNALLEAQSWGVPAVVSDIPGNRAVVRDGENGIVVAVGDTNAFAEGILRLLRDDRLRQRLGRAARQRAERDFSIESVARRVTAVYEQIAGTSRAGVSGEGRAPPRAGWRA